MSKTPICDRWEYDSYSGGLVVPLNVAKDLETRLAEARARITILEGCINDMTEEQAAICAEGQSMTELVAAKDKLIEQMRQALEEIVACGRADSEDAQEVVIAKAALEAAERNKQMSNDVECPYYGAEQDINHDDGLSKFKRFERQNRVL